MSKSIVIPAVHYVGFCKRNELACPLGFMTPDGTDAAAIKRKTTVDDWAKRNSQVYDQDTRSYKHIPIVSHTFQNVPTAGFRLTSDIRTSSYGGETKWKIEDPRGFCLEVTSGNLGNLLSYCTIENGEILDACVWAREGQTNVLLPISSDEYKAAEENTKRKASKISIKDLKPGDFVAMQNGDEMVYLGNMFHVGFKNPNRSYRGGDKNKDQFEAYVDGTRHVFVTKGTSYHPVTYKATPETWGYIRAYKDVKVAYVLESNYDLGFEYTQEEIQKYVNDCVIKNDVSGTAVDNKMNVFLFERVKPYFEATPIDEDTFKSLVKNIKYRNGLFCYYLNNPLTGVQFANNYTRHTPGDHVRYNIASLTDDTLAFSPIGHMVKSGYWSSSHWEPVVVKSTVAESEMKADAFGVIKFVYKNKFGEVAVYATAGYI